VRYEASEAKPCPCTVSVDVEPGARLPSSARLQKPRSEEKASVTVPTRPLAVRRAESERPTPDAPRAITVDVDTHTVYGARVWPKDTAGDAASERPERVRSADPNEGRLAYRPTLKLGESVESRRVLLDARIHEVS